MTDNIEEQVSEFFDGELAEQHRDHLLKQLKDKQHQARWHRYQIMRDVIQQQLPDTLNHDLSSRVQNALENEPTLLAPARQEAPSAPTQSTERSSPPASLWAFGLAASVAMVGLVGFQLGLFTENNGATDFATAKNTQAPALVRPVAGVEAPVVKPQPPQILQPQSEGEWKRLSPEDMPQFSPFYVEQGEFSVAPGAAQPQKPLAKVVTFGENQDQ